MAHGDEVEARILDWFWPEAHDAGHRLELLKRCAVLIVPRDPSWHDEPHGAPRGERAASCFACLSASRSLTRHHIIPVQNGGSDSLRNLVTICDVCHSSVHGRVLPNKPQPHPGMHSLADIMDGDLDIRRFVENLRRRLDAEKARG